MRKFRLLIVDDEPAARDGTRRLLTQDPEIVVVGEHGNGVDAAAAIIVDAPDIVLLDIQMPDLDGFGCLALLDPVARPEVIFLTAHDEHAVKAFDVDAADYVLKPFSEARLMEAIGRAKHRVGTRAREQHALTRIVVRQGGTSLVIPVEEIDWIEGANYYTRVHCGPKSHLLRQPLRQLLTRLDAEQFLRVHRSIIVNARRVKQLLPPAELALVLTSGKRLPVSRRLRPRLQTFLKNRV